MTSWLRALGRTAVRAQRDNLTDRAAALTYYGVLSLFPGLLVLISALGLAGKGTTRRIIDNITGLTPGAIRTVLTSAIRNLQAVHTSTAGALAIVGVLGALWTASGYLGAFMRACNAIYGLHDERPIWKTALIRIGMTILTGALIVVISLSVVLTGALAHRVGDLLHLGATAVTVWDLAKWPVLVFLISVLFAVLYWLAPSTRDGGFRWASPGAVLAVIVWLLASGGFALYVANFGSYNKTYGGLAAVIVFLVWLWLSNVAILLGAEFDAELRRDRAAVRPPPAPGPALATASAEEARQR